jgi:hypothetical protein
MRVTGGEEAGGSDPAPGRNRIENSATMQPDLRCSFIAEGYCLTPAERVVGYSVETHRLQMSFIHIGGSQTHAKLGNYSFDNSPASYYSSSNFRFDGHTSATKKKLRKQQFFSRHSIAPILFA